MDSTNNSYFWSNFEQYSVIAICLWNQKQQIRFKKKCNFADFGTNFCLCGIRLQFTKCTVWPRNVTNVKCGNYGDEQKKKKKFEIIEDVV